MVPDIYNIMTITYDDTVNSHQTGTLNIRQIYCLQKDNKEDDI